MKPACSVWIVAIALTLVAALPRFFELGSLGFYGDEETTALASRALAEEGIARMPSGMPYRRALPQTYLNAASVRIFGADAELAYRVPAAVFGTLTVPLLFLIARPWVGFGVAFLAALLLSVSEWHIATSREARMYAPFLLFYTAAVFLFWRWAVEKTRRTEVVGAVALLLGAVAFQKLGIMAALLVFVPLGFRGWSKQPVGLLSIVAVGAGALAWGFDRIVAAPLTQWGKTNARGTAVTQHLSDHMDSTTAQLGATLLNDPLLAAGIVIGGVFGFAITRRAIVDDVAPGAWIRAMARYALAVTAGAFTATGHLQGAVFVWFLFLLLYPYGLVALIRVGRWLWVALAGLALVSVGVTTAALGLRTGVKQLLMFPFPYSGWLLMMLSGVFALFALTVVYAAVRPLGERERLWRALAFAVLLPVLGAGILSSWGGMRYLIETYPFMLLAAATGLLAALEWFGRRTRAWSPRAAIAIGSIIVLSGVLGGHGIPQALRTARIQHGDAVNKLVFDVPVYPDHQGPGRFVAERLQANDLVVAEDVIEQIWYAGRVDYGLRDPEFFRPFHYRATDGRIRDIYANSEVAGAAEIERLRNERSRRIWVITSGETAHVRARELSAEQAGWMENIARTVTPAFVGRDGLSRVYCLNCAPVADTPG